MAASFTVMSVGVWMGQATSVIRYKAIHLRHWNNVYRSLIPCSRGDMERGTPYSSSASSVR